MSCEVCGLGDSKYKCTCTLKYCSVSCYKNHKANQICQKAETPIKSIVKKQLEVSNKRDYPREDLVPPKLLEYLKTSSKLRGTLQNPHLRDLLKNLTAQDNPAKMLDNLMKEPIFVEFADSCLDVIEPPDL